MNEELEQPLTSDSIKFAASRNSMGLFGVLLVCIGVIFTLIICVFIIYKYTSCEVVLLLIFLDVLSFYFGLEYLLMPSAPYVEIAGYFIEIGNGYKTKKFLLSEIREIKTIDDDIIIVIGNRRMMIHDSCFKNEKEKDFFLRYIKISRRLAMLYTCQQ